MGMSRVQKGFDRLAAIYDGLASLVYGRSLKRAQVHFLPDLPKNAKVLMLGGGSGWLLVELIRQAEPAEIAYVELSSKMKAKAQAKVKKAFQGSSSPPIDWTQSDVWTMDLPREYDLVICPCFLDLFPDERQAALLKQIGQHLQPDASMLFADFRKAEKWPMQGISIALIWLMYRFFRLVCGIEARRLPAFDQHLAAAGWRENSNATFFGGMIQAKLLHRNAKK